MIVEPVKVFYVDTKYACLSQRLQELVAVQGRIRQGTLPILRHSHLTKLVKDAGLDLDEDELQQV